MPKFLSTGAPTSSKRKDDPLRVEKSENSGRRFPPGRRSFLDEKLRIYNRAGMESWSLLAEILPRFEATNHAIDPRIVRRGGQGILCSKRSLKENWILLDYFERARRPKLSS